MLVQSQIFKNRQVLANREMIFQLNETVLGRFYKRTFDVNKESPSYTWY